MLISVTDSATVSYSNPGSAGEKAVLLLLKRVENGKTLLF